MVPRVDRNECHQAKDNAAEDTDSEQEVSLALGPVLLTGTAPVLLTVDTEREGVDLKPFP